MNLMAIPAFLLGLMAPTVLPQPQTSPLPIRAQLMPVVDTTIDPSTANINYGREPSLVLGSRRAILIDFPQLRWQRYNGKKLSSARLTFRLSRGTSVGNLSVATIKRPWSEGQGRSLRFDRPDPKLVPWGNATWSHAIQGKDGTRWDQPGATGTSDSSPITGVTATIEGQNLIIDGLTEAVQYQINNPGLAFGFRIETDSNIAFYSGEWTSERPTLNLTWEDTPNPSSDLALIAVTPSGSGQYLALLKNLGGTAIETATLSTVDQNGTASPVGTVGPIPPGGTKSLTLTIRNNATKSDPRTGAVTIQAAAVNDGHLGNNALTIYPAGMSIAFEASPERLADLKRLSPNADPMTTYQSVLEYMNTFVFPFSRFVQTPEGIVERLNLVLDPTTADLRVDLDQLASFDHTSIAAAITKALIPLNLGFRIPPSDQAPYDRRIDSNLSWLADTRDDGLRIPSLELPTLGFDSANNSVPLWENGLISRIESAFLNNRLLAPTRTKGITWVSPSSGVLIRAANANGDSLTNTEIVLQTSDGKAISTNTGNAGIAYFTGDDLKKTGVFQTVESAPSAWVLVTASRSGARATTWLAAWQLLDWSVRGNSSLPSVELRFNIPAQAVDLNQELAQDKPVTDSANRFPAQLAALNDNNPNSELELASGQWVEIDLGRDRILAQIDLTIPSGTNPQLEFRVYGTSQTQSVAMRWIQLGNLAQLARLYGKEDASRTTIPIFGTLTQARYLMIFNPGQTTAKINQIRVYAARPGM
jgi:hypothetical protein